MAQGENPSDVLKKIDDFISNKDNSEGLIDNIGGLMKILDNTEQIIQGMGDEGYRKEMLGYVTVARTQTMNILDAFDSMMDGV